jgi:Flp pilus assembly protein TadG
MELTRRTSRNRKGQALIEVALLLGICLIVISGMFLFGPILKYKFAVNRASYDCAVSAMQSLNTKQGLMQGYLAAQESLSAFGVNYGRARIDLKGNWGRGGQVVCTVLYDLPLERMPLAIIVAVPDSVSSSTVLPVQRWKSLWR